MTSGFAEAAVWPPQAELINTLNIQTHTLFSHNDENKDQIAKNIEYLNRPRIYGLYLKVQ